MELAALTRAFQPGGVAHDHRRDTTGVGTRGWRKPYASNVTAQ